MTILFICLIWLLAVASFLSPITRGHWLEFSLFAASVALMSWLVFQAIAEVRGHRKIIVGVFAILVALLPLYPSYLVTRMKASAHHYDDTVERYKSIRNGMTVDDVARIFDGYRIVTAQISPDGQFIGVVQTVFARLNWYKGDDQIWIFHEDSRVIGKRMVWLSDPYPQADFPTVEAQKAKQAIQSAQ